MNAEFSGWNDKEDSAAGSEVKFDPSFERHDQQAANDDYPSVEDVTAAAVANAQQHHHQDGGNRADGSGSGRPSHEELVRACLLYTSRCV